MIKSIKEPLITCHISGLQADSQSRRTMKAGLVRSYNAGCESACKPRRARPEAHIYGVTLLAKEPDHSLRSVPCSCTLQDSQRHGILNQRLLNVTGLLFVLIFYSALSQALDLPGVIKYETIVELSVPVSGVVNRVLVEEGQAVAEGELLLELDDVPFKADVDKISAQLRLLKAERDSMEKEHGRNKELFERMVLSTVSLEDSELKLIRADSRWQARKSVYARVKYDLEKSRLFAPFAGRIIERFVEPGQTIRSEMQAPVLFRLADITSFIVEAEVDGDKIGLLAHGVELEIRLSGKTHHAKVKSSTLLMPGRSLAQPARYRVTVKLDKSAVNLRPGMPATLVLPGQHE